MTSWVTWDMLLPSSGEFVLIWAFQGMCTAYIYTAFHTHTDGPTNELKGEKEYSGTLMCCLLEGSLRATLIMSSAHA